MSIQVKMWVRENGGGNTHRYVWGNLLRGDISVPVVVPGAVGMTFQVFGEFGIGGKIVLEGSCERGESGAHFFVLRDQGDAFVSFWKAGGVTLAPVVTSLRPTIVGGDGATSLTAVLLVRSS